MSNRLKIVILSLPVFLILSMALIKTAPSSETEALLVSSAQAKTDVSCGDEFVAILTDSDEDSSFPVNSINTNYFRARVGTTWEYSGYSRDVSEDDIKRESVYKKLTVLRIEKSGDKYNLEVSNSETDKNENWVVNDQYFSDKSSYIEFPLHYGKRWLYQGEDDGSDWAKMTKNRADGFYQNRVEEVLKNKVLAKDCYVVGYNTNSDRSYSIFCDKIGIVENFYKHNGTIGEYRDHLVKYRY